jgi:hypothetical protein
MVKIYRFLICLALLACFIKCESNTKNNIISNNIIYPFLKELSKMSKSEDISKFFKNFSQESGFFDKIDFNKCEPLSALLNDLISIFHITAEIKPESDWTKIVKELSLKGYDIYVRYLIVQENCSKFEESVYESLGNVFEKLGNSDFRNKLTLHIFTHFGEIRKLANEGLEAYYVGEYDKAGKLFGNLLKLVANLNNCFN